jgi:hypothetical protein
LQIKKREVDIWDFGSAEREFIILALLGGTVPAIDMAYLGRHIIERSTKIKTDTEVSEMERMIAKAAAPALNSLLGSGIVVKIAKNRELAPAGERTFTNKSATAVYLALASRISEANDYIAHGTLGKPRLSHFGLRTTVNKLLRDKEKKEREERLSLLRKGNVYGYFAKVPNDMTVLDIRKEFLSKGNRRALAALVKYHGGATDNDSITDAIRGWDEWMGRGPRKERILGGI